MQKKVLDRKDVQKEYTWDLRALYPDEASYEHDLSRIQKKADALETSFKGQLQDAASINQALDSWRELLALLQKASTYAHLNLSVDQTDQIAQERQSKMALLASSISSQLSFIESDLLKASPEVIEQARQISAENSRFLQDALAWQPHRLSPETEKVLQALAPVLDAPYEIYEQAKLGDMQFPSFKAHGKDHALSFVLFENSWEYDPDPAVRRAAFTAFSETLRSSQHTFARAYRAQVEKEKRLASLRGFDSVIDYLLFEQKVPRALYDRQIDVLMRDLPSIMKKYVALLQQVHHLPRMTYSDLKIPVDPGFEPAISIEEARGYVQEALSVLGPQYQEMVRRAFDERWIDFVQNKGKSTGAFCSSIYTAHPYILISWSERMREVFVLAHELGHAGHFSEAPKYNTLFDVRCSRYFIEAPSTMNEMLMARHLLQTRPDDARFKRWVLSCIISRTYYHNFVTHLLEAAFQREVYRLVDQGEAISASVLNRLYRETLQAFWGDAVELTEGAELTWMRQPHYYMGLYPYTYSAGLTVATQVSQRIQKEGTAAIEDWMKVLRAGGSLDPVALAALAKVDITTEGPLRETVAYVDGVVDQIIALSR